MAFDIATHRARPIPASGVLDLYRQEGWWPERTPGDVAVVIAGGPAVGAWDGDRLVGFARAVTDGRFRAYVEDVVVAASHRRSGCGSDLLEALREELADIDVVTLFCHRDLTGFYEAAGFSFTTQRIGHRPGSEGDAR